MSENGFEFKDNKDGTITKTMDSGEEFVYNILVGGNIPKGESIIDYCYFQKESDLVTELNNSLVDEDSFCSGTCTAMILAITYGDKSITPISVLYWGDENDEDNREVNWTWETDVNGNYIYDENGNRKDMGLKAWEQDNYTISAKQVYDNRDKGENGKYGGIVRDIENYDDYLDDIKTYLSEGLPVIIELDGHYVVVVGVESGVELDKATLNQLVIFDPGSDNADKIVAFGKSSKGYQVKTYRMLTPYPIDSDKQFVYNENDEKTHDPYYVDPVKREEDGSIVPSETGRMIKEITASIDNSNLSDYDKERIGKQMIKEFTGEDDVAYDILSAVKNNNPTEFMPVVYKSGKTSGEVVDISNGLSVSYAAGAVPSAIIITVTNLLNGKNITKEVKDWVDRDTAARISNIYFDSSYISTPVSFCDPDGRSVGGLGTVPFSYSELEFNYRGIKSPYYIVV